MEIKGGLYKSGIFWKSTYRLMFYFSRWKWGNWPKIKSFTSSPLKPVLKLVLLTLMLLKKSFFMIFVNYWRHLKLQQTTWLLHAPHERETWSGADDCPAEGAVLSLLCVRYCNVFKDTALLHDGIVVVMYIWYILAQIGWKTDTVWTKL